MGGITRPANAVQWRGVWLDPQTRDMLEELARISGSLYIRPIQGCWSTSTTASAGTHSRACVVDIDAEAWTDAQAKHVSALWRSLGGFGWFRPRYSPTGRSYGWQRHCHLAHPDGDMAPALADQWADYKAGRNGLADNGPDPETRAFVGVTWAAYQEVHVMATLDEVRAMIRAELGAVPKAVWEFPVPNHDVDPNDKIAPSTYAARSYMVMANWRAAQLQAAVAQLTGVDVDEKALAASLAPVIRDAVIAAGQPEAVADAVVAKLGTALSG